MTQKVSSLASSIFFHYQKLLSVQTILMNYLENFKTFVCKKAGFLMFLTGVRL